MTHRDIVMAISTGVYVVHAMTDDGVTHLAEMYVRSYDDMAIQFRCRSLIIDSYGDARSHLRQPDGFPVDCMTCLVMEQRT